MPTYAVVGKDGKLLEVIEAGSVATARIDASRSLLEVGLATTDQIVEWAKGGRDVRKVGKQAPEPKPKVVDPAQTDLVRQIEEQGKGPIVQEQAPPAAASKPEAAKANPMGLEPEPEPAAGAPEPEPAGELAASEKDELDDLFGD